MLQRPLLIALALALCLPARAVELRLDEAPPPPAKPLEAPQEVELKANGDYRALRLSAQIVQVGLVRDDGGHCRAGRTWGFDDAHDELWVSGRCAGRFRLLTAQHVAPASPGDPAADAQAQREQEKAERNQKLAVGAAAAAVVVGAVLLSRKKDAQAAGSENDPRDDPYGPRRDARPLQTVEGALCLDLRGGLQQGAEAMVAHCRRSESQAFVLNDQGELRVGRYLCLDVAGGQRQDGARVVAWACNGQRNQQWRRHGRELRSLHADKCLDVKGARFRDGESVLLWRCTGRNNQQWW